jgi:uncharacterized protein (DUF433 family)
MQYLSQIVCTPDTLLGSPRIQGRRISVGDVVCSVESCSELEENLFDFDVTYDQIFQALFYCSTLQCKKDNPEVFCHNCSLRRDKDGPLDISDLHEFNHGDNSYVKSANVIFIGSLAQLLEDWKGKDMWSIATDLLIKFGDDLITLR